jgi:hypothetical protein
MTWIIGAGPALGSMESISLSSMDSGEIHERQSGSLHERSIYDPGNPCAIAFPSKQKVIKQITNNYRKE